MIEKYDNLRNRTNISLVEDNGGIKQRLNEKTYSND